MKYKELIGEKEVEHFWWSILEEFFPNSRVEARNTGKNTDGLLIDEDNKIRTLIEVKEDLEMTKSIDQAKVLIQSIFYIKKYEKDGVKLPKAVLIADKNECFIVHTNSLLKYLDYDIDWSSAPSNAYKSQPEMLMNISEDETINPFVFDITYNEFNFNAIKNKIIDLNQNVKRLIKINDDNIQNVFDYFIKNVLMKNKNTINEQVNLFIDLLINPDENYLHPRKKNTVHSKSLGFIKANEKNFINFFNHFDGDQYTVREKENMVSIIDRLVEDETRKRNGEFFTPKIWVDEAHKMISEQFGSDWKEKYVVWDCAWGTGNLTRDYKFKELYCSTLHESDIQTATQMKINPEATKFQFDFLNDDLEYLKEPNYAPGLYKAIKEGKEILFLINPPYGTASNFDVKKTGKSKKDINKTETQKHMKDDDMGYSTKNLYTQFLYKISTIKNSSISIFSPPLFLTGQDMGKFRTMFFNTYEYQNGMLFQASNFSDVKSTWGISFTMFKQGITNKKVYVDIKQLDKNYKIETMNKKYLYSIDKNDGCNYWVKKNINNKEKIETPKLTSGLILHQDGYGNLTKNAIAEFVSCGNSVYKNQTDVFILTSAYKNKNGISIELKNYKDFTLFFTARKTIKQNWINDKDEYIAPSIEVQNTLEYKQYNNDAIVYSLFNTSSNQSSMRQVEYKDKLWDIKNEFFWLSKEEMMDLSDKYYFDELYQDARSSDDRFVYKLLNGKLSESEFEEVGITHVDENNKPILSPDAQELLDLSKDLIKKSFKMRKFMNEEYPEYHLNTWDAGWYQMKKVLNEYFKEDYKVFVKKYKGFEDRMRPYVYKFGFLK